MILGGILNKALLQEGSFLCDIEGDILNKSQQHEGSCSHKCAGLSRVDYGD